MGSSGPDGGHLPPPVVDPRQGYEQLSGSSVCLADVVVVADIGSGSSAEEDEFERVAGEVALALDSGVHAQLIAAGSSGAYYVRDGQEVTIQLWMSIRKLQPTHARLFTIPCDLNL